MTITASFNLGTGLLSVFGDSLDNSTTISRDAAGTIRINNGAVPILGGVATVANTKFIRVFGQAGDDTITLDETNGALPPALLFGGSGKDTLTGGSAADQLFGQSGDDTLIGKGGSDLLFGGVGNDVLTGGDGDDQVFGQGGNDRMIWNPGDDTDLFEGGADIDTAEVNGGNGAEIFTATANGARVRFDRLDPAPFALDIGTTENLVVNMNGGNDSFSATGDLSSLIKLTVDGGTGNDTIRGGNGVDLLLGGDGDDFIDGNQGNDVAFLGAGGDVFQWDPGDGSDTVEGQAGFDKFVFNGSNIGENIDVSANGGRMRLFRDVGNVTMDTDDVERVEINALGGADNIVIGDLTGTDIAEVNISLASTLGGSLGDGLSDTITINATNGDDVIVVTGGNGAISILGLAARVNIVGFETTFDHLVINARAGDDVLDASGLGTSLPLTANGGDGDDVLIGGTGNDALFGDAGDDVLLGGPGVDVLDGGSGSNILIQ